MIYTRTLLPSGMGIAGPSLGEGLSGFVYALAVSHGALYAGGQFFGEWKDIHIAKWDGLQWSPVGEGVNGFGFVNALAVYKGDLYAAGSFTLADAQAASNIAKWDGQEWSPVGSGLGPEADSGLDGSGKRSHRGQR